MIDLNRANNEFRKYIKKYDPNNKKVKLKISHIERTSKISRKIAEDLKLEQEDAQLAELIGLLHDIGRFEQIRKYNTFIDKISVNHGELGAKILFEDGLIRKFIEEDTYDNVIKTSILNHNKDSKKINKEISKKEMLHTKIIRDADKTDIMYILTFDDLEACYEKSDFSEEKITDNIYKQFIEEKRINYQNMQTSADILVAHFAYVYDFNFNYGLKKIYENDYIGKLYKRFNFKNEQTCKRCDNMYGTVQEYLKKQI